MTCTWCSNEAKEGGRAPIGVSGLRFIAGCETHANKIGKLKYIPISIKELETILNLEKRKEKLNK